MNRLTILRTSTVLTLLALAVACSDDDEKLTNGESTGGATGSGGSTPGSGGNVTSSGGATAAGGTATSGGTTAVTDGGTTATQGGTTTVGGTTASGGATSTAGTTSTAGKTSTGGITSGAGTTSAGGATPIAGTAGAVTAGGAPANGGTTSTAGGPTSGGAAGDTSLAGANTGGVDNTAGDTGAGGTNGAAGAEGTAGAAGAPATAAYCLGSTAAFCDDFEDGDATGWTQIDQTSATPGIWTVGSEAGYNSVTSYDLQQTADAAVGYHYNIASTAAGGPWGDQTVTAWLKANSAIGGDNTKVGVCARMTGTNNSTLTGYCLFLRNNATAKEVQLSRKPTSTTSTSIGTVLTVSLTDPGLFAASTWYKVSLSVVGTTSVTLTGYINDVQVIAATDDAPTPGSTGYPGVVTRQGSAGAPAQLASFDNVTLTSP